MKKIYPEQLNDALQKKLYHGYIIYGDEPLFFQESKDLICNIAKKKFFKEKFNIIVNNDTNWDFIFNICNNVSLFSKAQILILNFSSEKLNHTIRKNLLTLSNLLHDTLLLLICIKKLNQEYETLFKKINKNMILIPCFSPKIFHLSMWIINQSKKLNLILTPEINNLLCYYYEGNLVELSQVLMHLSLLYPKKKIILSDVEKIINDCSNFTIFHWIDALLLGKKTRALRILNQIKDLEDISIPEIIYYLQREIIFLLNLKRKKTYFDVEAVFEQLQIWQTRRLLLKKAIKRIKNYDLYQTIMLLTQSEKIFQKEPELFWINIETLSLILCDIKILNII